MWKSKTGLGYENEARTAIYFRSIRFSKGASTMSGGNGGDLLQECVRVIDNIFSTDHFLEVFLGESLYSQFFRFFEFRTRVLANDDKVNLLRDAGSGRPAERCYPISCLIPSEVFECSGEDEDLA